MIVRNKVRRKRISEVSTSKRVSYDVDETIVHHDYPRVAIGSQEREKNLMTDFNENIMFLIMGLIRRMKK